jgi:hypothetical protein
MPGAELDIQLDPALAPPADPKATVVVHVGGAPYLIPRRLETRSAEILKGKYDFGGLPDVPRARRVVDVRAGIGDFACWAWSRWRNVWVECYEPDPDLRAFLLHNLPPGGAVHADSIDDAASAASLPACDVLMLDAGGNEADILRGYKHRASVVCFEWHRAEDRLPIEQTLASWGLRCFRIAFRNPDLGHEVWVRSRAVWDVDKKAWVLP